MRAAGAVVAKRGADEWGEDSMRGSVASQGRPQVFYIMVNEEDADMFRSFLNSSEGFDHMWGLRSREDDAGKAFRTGDIVYLGLSTASKLVVCGRVSHTSAAHKIPAGQSTERAPDTARIIDFSHLRPVQVIYEDLFRHDHMSRGSEYTVSQVVDNYVDDVMYKCPVRDPIFVPPDVMPPVDYISPPDKTRYVTMRAIRDTANTRKLRELYGNRCQACGYALEAAAGSLHSEVHHLWPLHEGGTDTPDNMVVLCPQHHAELDYGAAYVDESGLAITGGGGGAQKLHFEPGHVLEAKNVAHGMQKAGRAETRRRTYGRPSCSAPGTSAPERTGARG